MALRVCPECAEAVSEHAASCPHCGFQTAKTQRSVGRAITMTAVGGAALLAGLAGGWTMRARQAPPSTPPAVVAVATHDHCDCDSPDDKDDKDETDTAKDDTALTLTRSQDAYVHGDYASAIRIANQALSADPLRAWRIIGASNCFLRDRGAAHQAWNKLDARGRSFLMYVCSRNDIALP